MGWKQDYTETQPEIPSASESQNHGMLWVGMDLKEHLTPALLTWTGGRLLTFH